MPYNCRIFRYGKVESIKKEVVAIYFKVQSRHSRGNTEESHEKRKIFIRTVGFLAREHL